MRRPRVPDHEPRAALGGGVQHSSEVPQAPLVDPMREALALPELARETGAHRSLRGPSQDQHVLALFNETLGEAPERHCRPAPRVRGVSRVQDPEARAAAWRTLSEQRAPARELLSAEKRVEWRGGRETTRDVTGEVPDPLDEVRARRGGREFVHGEPVEGLAPVLWREPDPTRRTRDPRDDRALQVALRIEREVGTKFAQLARERRPGSEAAVALEREDPRERRDELGEGRLDRPTEL